MSETHCVWCEMDPCVNVTESTPDWWLEKYHPHCRRRKEFCTCYDEFADKVANVHMNYFGLKRKREGVGPPGHKRYG